MYIDETLKGGSMQFSGKKNLNMLILNILKEYTDEDHRLMQKDIITILARDYQVDIDRRSVKNNILSLIEMGYDVNIENGYYLEEREFEDAELRLLIDSVLFSKTLPASQAKKLIKKLESFGNKYFDAKVSHVSTTPALARTENKNVLYSVNAINDAIDKKRKITFRYLKYGEDFKLHDMGREYLVNPYQMVAANGHYYLLGNYDKYDDVSYYRIDKMKDVDISEQPVKPMKEVAGLENGLDLPKHMAEHIYMYCGESAPVKIRCGKGMIDPLIDWFGKDIKIIKSDKEKDEIVVRIMCNYDAMIYWVLQYGQSVEVIEPKSMRDELRDITSKMAEKYSK